MKDIKIGKIYTNGKTIRTVKKMLPSTGRNSKAIQVCYYDETGQEQTCLLSSFIRWARKRQPNV